MASEPMLMGYVIDKDCQLADYGDEAPNERSESSTRPMPRSTVETPSEP